MATIIPTVHPAEVAEPRYSTILTATALPAGLTGLTLLLQATALPITTAAQEAAPVEVQAEAVAAVVV